jgi:hypothetical protein
MATIETQQGEKDVISPTNGKYTEKYEFVLDEKTHALIQVRVVRTVSS